MARVLRSVKTFKKSWDSDKALKNTYQGKVGKYQLRAYIFLAFGYAVVLGWLAEMPTYALLPPKSMNCSSLDDNLTSLVLPTTLASSTKLIKQRANRTTTFSPILKNDQNTISQPKNVEISKNTFSKEYGNTVLTDFDRYCNPIYEKIPHIVYLVGLILGGLIFGYMADHSGRKMILLGSMWAACFLSVFQLLSEDYISYVFFSLFVGIAIGAVQVIAVPFVIEMFPVELRAVFGLLLTATMFLFNLVLPGFAIGLKSWKIFQGIVTAPIIFTGFLYWFTEESMFWHTAQKDYVTAVLSLKKIARFNGIVFEDIFHEAKDFLRGKRSKAVQCDFQPLLRLEDIKLLGEKYPDFDMVDLQATTGKKNTFSQRLVQILTGHHYYPTLSMFYPTDFLHSSILSIYLLLLCGLWLVSSLTEYSLDTPMITDHLAGNFFLKQFYKYVVQIGSFLIAFPMVYKWGRRWPTFCFFLVAEVCLLGSVAVRLDADDKTSAMLAVYFIGKFASRGGFVVLLQYTSEIFPTGLRCTAVGICYTFRLIGIALASKDLAGLNDRMPRLIYGILSLVLGSMALLLPETKKIPLPRTMIQVEMIPTSVSKKFRRHRPLAVNKRPVRPDGQRHEGGQPFNDAASTISGIRSVRFGPYDVQSTLHSVYDVQEFGQDDTVGSTAGRNPRRIDLRNPALFQPYSAANQEMYRQQLPIAEEYDEDVDDDRTRYAQQQRLSEHHHQRLNEQQLPTLRSEEPNIIPAFSETIALQELNSAVTKNEVKNEHAGSTSAVTDDLKEEEVENLTEDGNQTYRPNLNEDENYFSEHC